MDKKEGMDSHPKKDAETKTLGNTKEAIKIENIETKTEKKEKMEIKDKVRAETEETGTETKEKNTK